MEIINYYTDTSIVLHTYAIKYRNYIISASFKLYVNNLQLLRSNQDRQSSATGLTVFHSEYGESKQAGRCPKRMLPSVPALRAPSSRGDSWVSTRNPAEKSHPCEVLNIYREALTGFPTLLPGTVRS